MPCLIQPLWCALLDAVYHFTDLPSFVSGEHLVMFDPHTKYVPGATHVQPGIKVGACPTQLGV